MRPTLLAAMVAAASLAACGGAQATPTPVPPSPSASPTGAAAGYLALAGAYNRAENGIIDREQTDCDLTKGSLSACRTDIGDDIAATQQFGRGLRQLQVPADAVADRDRLIADQDALVAALREAQAQPTLLDIARVTGSTVLPKVRNSQHDAFALRTDLGLPIPTPPPATPSPS